MVDLYEAGRKVLGVGKYISIKDLIEEYPDGVTVNGIRPVNFKDKKGNIAPKPVMTFNEDPTLYFTAAAGDLGKLVGAWTAKAGSIEAVDDYLAKNNVGLKIWYTRTSDNNIYTKVALLKKVSVNTVNIPAEVELPEDEVVDEETGEVIQPEQTATDSVFSPF